VDISGFRGEPEFISDFVLRISDFTFHLGCGRSLGRTDFVVPILMPHPFRTAAQSRLRHQLLWRIGRRYQVVSEEARVGPLVFSFTRIVDPDRVLDDVAAQADLRDRLNGSRADGDEIHLPYWAELWDSARAIGQYLAEAGLVKADRSAVRSSACRVLDLGCGMGMAGTVAAGLGARVVFADLEPPALLFARLNSLPWRHRVQTHRLNWQRDRLGRRFDLILGADILYERAQWPFLEPFWREHLADGGRVILGEPGRQTGDVFPDWIAGRGWDLQRASVSVATRPTPIRVFILKLQSPIA